MTLSFILPLLLAFAPQSSNANVNTFYDNHAVLSSSEQCRSLSCPADSNKSYYIDTLIEFSCNLDYDDAYSFYLSNFNFRVTASVYYYDFNDYNIVLDRQVVLNQPFYWEFTAENDHSAIDSVSFRVGIDSQTDNAYISCYVDEDELNSIWSNQLDDSWDNMPTSKLDITLNTNNFWTAVYNYCSSVDETTINNIYDDGYADGYVDGFNEGISVDTTAVTIFNGILNIALVPINFFLAMFNFEILGINISQLVSAILSICLVIIVVRFVTGKSQGGE